MIRTQRRRRRRKNGKRGELDDGHDVERGALTVEVDARADGRSLIPCPGSRGLEDDGRR